MQVFMNKIDFKKQNIPFTMVANSVLQDHNLSAEEDYPVVDIEFSSPNYAKKNGFLRVSLVYQNGYRENCLLKEEILAQVVDLIKKSV